MPSSKFYGMTFWTLNEANQVLTKAIELAVTTTETAEYSDHASADLPVAGEPAVFSAIYPNSNEYATLADATSPNRPASESRHFLFCSETKSAGTTVCNFNEAVGATWLNSFMNWLAYWFPELHASVVSDGSLSAASTRLAVVNKVSVLINPLVPPLAYGG